MNHRHGRYFLFLPQKTHFRPVSIIMKIRVSNELLWFIKRKGKSNFQDLSLTHTSIYVVLRESANLDWISKNCIFYRYGRFLERSSFGSCSSSLYEFKKIFFLHIYRKKLSKNILFLIHITLKHSSIIFSFFVKRTLVFQFFFVILAWLVLFQWRQKHY